MALFDFFKKSELSRWKSIDKATEEVINDLKGYLNQYILKVEAFQYIILKIFDFKNIHIFEKDEKILEDRKITRGSVITTNEIKLYKKYQRIIKKRAKTIKKILNSTSKQLISIDTNLTKIPLKSGELESDLEKIKKFEKEIESLKKLLELQLDIIENILTEFKIFVGDKKIWEENLWRNKERKSIEEKNRIISQWDLFINSMNEYKNLLREENRILFGTKLDEDIANWEVEILNKIKNVDFFATLFKIQKFSKKMIAWAKEDKIEIYHSAEEYKEPLPLYESEYRGGFFVCTESPRYSQKIKSDHFNEPFGKIYTYKIMIPKSLFITLFIPDKHIGKPSDEVSEEAYEHAYVLPVSRFPLFNFYFSEGLIK
jgi:hypothetical protein